MKSQLEGEQGRDYDVNHSLVERKIITTVAMTREMLSQEANRKKLIEKPLVARVQAENKKGDRGRDQFYGPNLQVLWGDDTEAMKRGSKRGSGRGSGRDDDRSDGDVSPTDEVRGVKRSHLLAALVVTVAVTATAVVAVAVAVIVIVI